MTDRQIIDKAINKAIENGYQYDKKEMSLYSYHIIFSHPFAKAFWGEDLHLTHTMNYGGDEIRLPAWQYHLQQMVLEEEPLKYLSKFLD